MKDTETGLTTEGVLLEDLEVPGAVLCPRLDDAGVMLTIQHVAKHHANFWNSPDLASGALGVKPHNGPWYQPGWGDDIAAYWPRFQKKWETRDARRARELPPEAFAAGEAIMHSFAWIQDELSKKPHTFNHGDVKPPNMFMMPGEQPAFIDWQYTAVGKGCQDIVFFLIEGYDVDECRRLEPICLAHYHAALVHNGILGYSIDDLKRDWQLACMHFPFYVAMWFGTTPDDQLVDPSFPRRFVPRAFDAILRNCAHHILPKGPPGDLTIDVSDADHGAASGASEDKIERLFGAMPSELPACQQALVETRAALSEVIRQRDALRAAMETIANVAQGSVAGDKTPSSPPR